jgi:hypothetical protein
MPRELQGWRSVQGLGPGGAIDSDERVRVTRAVVERSEAGARRLGDRYWLEVRRASWGFVRPRKTAEEVELRILGRGPCVLRFGRREAVHDQHGVRCRYPILGGLLARRAGGAISLSQTGGDEPELRAAVTGFVPRLGRRAGLPGWSGALYEHIQRRAHVAISRRYFRRLIEEAQP